MMDFSSKLKALSVILYVCIDLIYAQDIIGCGGFVKSEVEINFSLIEVKLYTKQGSLKYQTDCAPNNGYYMIPIYDKGDYLIKVEPPPGWTFDPLSVELHVDGETDKCSKGEDINFQFTGFGVVGKVISKGQPVGPAGVTLTLKKTENDEVVKSTETLAGGDFTFERVLPGEYYILASHHVWVFEKPSVDVTVGRETGNAGRSLTVMGFDVRGAVLSDGEPVGGVFFLLFSSTVQPQLVGGCEHEDVPGMPTRDGEIMICFVKSQVDGSFLFPALPTGSYTLVPFYRGERIFFDVQPNALEFTVEHNSLRFKDPFQVAGFSVSGLVLTAANGAGVAKARVLVDGLEQATTADDGSYSLDSMKTGTYSINVLTDHVFFDTTSVKITPNTPQLPTIIATRFNVCGQVVIDKLPEGLGHATQSRTIRVEDIVKSTEVLTSGTDGDGNFCMQLKPGKYVIKVVLSSTEQKAGLRLSPDSIDIEVTDKPVHRVKFTQFRAKVSGTVHCAETCGNVQLSISSLGRTEERKTVQATEADKGKAKFTFENIMPGKYKIWVQKEEWCWEEKHKEVEVTKHDVSSITFTQSGYILSTSLSHAITLNFEHESKPGNVGSFNLTKGVNKFCLKEAGVYQLTPVSCHQFEQAVYKYDTAKSTVMAMTAVKHRLEGSIVTATRETDIVVSIKSSLSDKPVNIGPLVSDKEPQQVEGDETSKPAEPEGPFTYTYVYWAKSGEKIEVSASSKLTIFYPETTAVTVSGDSCPKPVSLIEGRAGVFIDGVITPVISGVAVTITVEGNPDDKIELQSDEKGEYHVGPLHSHLQYSVTAEKDGYVMTPVDGKQGHFRAFKLGQISVKVDDEGGESLPGVLLSLSGGSYRSNKVTNDDGSMSFVSLSPGQYFLRPMMKEYQFEPASQMIDVLEGTTRNLEVKALRVAFSCYGAVTSLNGEAESGVYVEAVGLPNNRGEECQHLQEEAQTETDGSYRIRGLQPQCEYVVRVRSGEVNQHIERATPKAQLVRPVNSDISNINIIAFRRMNQLDISGNVITKREFLHTLKVHLYREINPDSPVHSVSMGDISFFYLPSLTIDNQVYTVRLDSSLPRSTYDYDLPEATFIANTSYSHFTFTFEPKRKPQDQELSQSSFLVLPLTLIIVLLAYNHQKLLPLLGESASWMQAALRSAPSRGRSSATPPPSDPAHHHINPDIWAEMQQSSNLKKKQKSRKA